MKIWKQAICAFALVSIGEGIFIYTWTSTTLSNPLLTNLGYLSGLLLLPGLIWLVVLGIRGLIKLFQ